MNARAHDIIIVGAGTAGCALAAGLAADTDRSILVIEAGAPRTHGSADHIEDPGFASMATLYGDDIWAYRVAPGVGPSAVIRGKGTGGSGGINGAYFLRGIPEDYDSWGSSLWAWDAVLRTFRAMETDADYQGDFHGDSGAVPVERIRRDRWRTAHEAFYVGALAQGVHRKDDMNHPEGSGVGPMPRNTRDGVRVAGDDAHLATAAALPNVSVFTGAEAVKILVHNGAAVGVHVVDETGRPQDLSATEVVLCAGALESPRLLMASGIGDTHALAGLGVEPIAALPGVGRNLRDHPAVIVDFIPDADVPEDNSRASAAVVMSYTADGSSERNDMKIFPHYGVDEARGREVVRFPCSIQSPRSIGHLSFTGERAVEVLVNFRFLRDPWDTTRLMEAIRKLHGILMSTSAQSVLPGRFGIDDKTLASDEHLESWIRTNLMGFLHSTGTCKMGPATDPNAVVDDHGRVYGVPGLRIADLSIVPSTLRGGPNATACMIGAHMAAIMMSE